MFWRKSTSFSTIGVYSASELYRFNIVVPPAFPTWIKPILRSVLLFALFSVWGVEITKSPTVELLVPGVALVLVVEFFRVFKVTNCF